MRLIVEMEDKDSLSAESAIDSLKPVFGYNSVIKAFPINNTPDAHLDFAINELLVHDLLEAYYDLWPNLYEEQADKIKTKLLDTLKLKIDEVEAKILHKLE
jgi:hypothetical protein